MRALLALVCALVCLTAPALCVNCGSLTYSATSLNEGQYLTLTYSKSGSFPSAQVNITVSWGDTTSNLYQYLPITRNNLTLQHVYATAGTYSLSVTTVSNASCSDSFSHSIIVANVAPSIVLNPTPANTIIYDGSAFTLQPITYFDPSTSETHTATVNWGDGSAVAQCFISEQPTGPPGSVSGLTGQAICGQHQYTNGFYTATVTITDSLGASVQATYTISEQSRLFVSPGAAQIADEGTTVGVTASYIDTVPVTHTATIVWGDGFVVNGTVLETVGASLTSGVVSGTHIYAQPGVYEVLISVAAASGAPAVSSAVVNVTIYQTAPLVNLTRFNPLSVLPGVSLPLPNCTFVGSPLDSYTAVVNWGDGTLDTALIYSFSFGGGVVVDTHVYAAAGVYTVDAIVTNAGSGQVGSSSASVIVRNTPPTVAPIGPQTAVAQVQFVLYYSFTDLSANDTHKAIVSWGDGTPIQTINIGAGQQGVLLNATHVYAAVGNYAANLSVVDNLGANGTQYFSVAVQQGPFTIVVQNFAPVVSQGSVYSLSATPQVTGGSSGFVFAVSWGDGTPPTSGAISQLYTHVYYVPGTYTVAMRLTNSDGSFVNDTLSVQVNNVAPNVIYVAPAATAGYGTHLQTASVNQGNAFVVSALYFDPGLYDTHTATVDWGDQNVTSLGTLAATNASGLGTLSSTHVYNNVGVYSLSVAVFDNSGAVGRAVLSLTVNDVPPVITVTPAPVLSGTLKFSGTLATCTDHSTSGTYSVTISWGDGTSSTSQTAVCQVQGTHTYAKKGIYFVLITVTDPNGGSSTATTTITLH